MDIIKQIVEDVLSVSTPALQAAAVGLGVAIEKAKAANGGEVPDHLEAFLNDAHDGAEAFINDLFDGLGLA